YLRLNTSGQVPTLVHGGTALTQSLAIIEYLEEILPGVAPLLPPAHEATQRARVRALAAAMVCDVQPLQNKACAERVSAIRGTEPPVRDAQFAAWAIARGFRAYDDALAATMGRFSVGDAFSLADVCLAPMAYNARVKYAMDLSPFPRICSVLDEVMDVPCIKLSHPDLQPPPLP
ncbi:hypothetical protein HK100_008553, partial [Physocladia obscura]